MTAPAVRLAREALFERLSGGHARRLTVVTPNRRLALALARDFDAAQATSGATAWDSADILPWSAFLERLWQEAQDLPREGEWPLLLSPVEEQALWESLVGESRQARELLSATAPASPSREAWQLLHAWRLAPVAAAQANEDTQAFGEWSSRYQRTTRKSGFIDAARLPDVLAPLLKNDALERPGTLVLYAFDLVTPQVQAFLEALAGTGTEVLVCEPPRHEGTAARVAVTSPGEEVAVAARWARMRLEASRANGRPARIGVVVPALAQSRLAVERVFAGTFHPGHHEPGSSPPARAFGITLGLPLSSYPLVHDALLVLRLAGREIAFADASRLLRSPFLAGAAPERAARARFDAALRERSGVTLSLDRLLAWMTAPGTPGVPLLLDKLGQLGQWRRTDLLRPRTPPDWARAFADSLRMAGFPGDRALDSAEFQVLGKWHETLAAFARLERVAGRMGYQEALGRLARVAADTLFQPESPDVPVQVMGILESAGLDFDHLWVMGLTDDAWPLAARPNAFLPVRAQRDAGIPAADAVSSLALDQRITEGWLRAAPEVVLSHALARGDALAAPSPLIAKIPQVRVEDLGVVTFPSWRDAIAGAVAIERVPDACGPPLADGAAPGGTAIFRDQAACPFRAFAAHRLRSTSPAVPQPGLGAADRGSLLHAVLAAAWDELRDKGRLDAIGSDELDGLLARAATGALEKLRRRRPHAVEGRFAAIERTRLAAIARAWLEVERGRSDFEVAATEKKISVTFGGVSVQAKLDRLDRLAAGGCAVIDYKTGEANVAAWLGPRPDEPQLPLYALASGEDIASLAFARVKVGESGFKGLARTQDLLPGVTTVSKNRSRLARAYADWPALQAGWQRELDALGRAIAAGDARLDPKRGADTCEGCAQRLVCRVASQALPDTDATEEGDE